MESSTTVLIIIGILAVWGAFRMFTFNIRRERR